MPAAQRSILSFFQSSSSSSPSSSPSSSSASSSMLPASASTRPAPLPPPPPPQSRFVPPPQSVAAAGPLRPAPPPGMATRSGGSADPKLDLPPITADIAAAIWTAAGATASDDDLVFPLPPACAASSAVRIAAPRVGHVPDLVSVNAILLSVRYPDAFYRPIADRSRVASLFNRVILDGDKVVGGLVCRLEPWPFGETEQKPPPQQPQPLVIYVQSLALLSPYRARGLAAAALDSLAATAAALNASGRLPPVRALYAHTWTESADVLHWYEARGFVRHGAAPVDNYYFALRPSTAWIMRRDLPAAAAAAAAAAATETETETATATATAAAAATDTQLPPIPASSLSFQNTRPDVEWNDLPADMMTVPSVSASASASAASSRNVSRSTSRLHLPSAAAAAAAAEDDQVPPAGPPTGSRSSSAARKKRDRAYPAAMFGQ